MGARTGQRSWRIGSLVLMLLGVYKVFIFDAAGVEGLARIASFFWGSASSALASSILGNASPAAHLRAEKRRDMVRAGSVQRKGRGG